MKETLENAASDVKQDITRTSTAFNDRVQGRRLVRPKRGRVIAGVALAIANYFNIDVTIVRLLWAFLLLPGGLPGLIPYIICWLVIPSED